MHANRASGRSRFSAETKCLYSKPIFRAARGAKLDAIFKLLLALVLMVVCVFLFQLGSGSLQISAPSTPSMQLQLPTLLIILLGRSLPSLSVSWDWMIWRLHSQPTAANVQAMIFSSNTLPASAEERKHFEDDWDLREFGVNSQDVDPISIEERA